MKNIFYVIIVFEDHKQNQQNSNTMNAFSIILLLLFLFIQNNDVRSLHHQSSDHGDDPLLPRVVSHDFPLHSTWSSDLAIPPMSFSNIQKKLRSSDESSMSLRVVFQDLPPHRTWPPSRPSNASSDDEPPSWLFKDVL